MFSISPHVYDSIYPGLGGSDVAEQVGWVVDLHGFYWAWLHFQRARVGACVQCSCVQNTG